MPINITINSKNSSVE